MLFLGLSIVAIVGAAQRPEYCGQQFSPNKIDYADPDITAPFEHVMNASACCQLCSEWNQNLTVTEGAANCTIAVWHGPGHYSCNLKHTANKPFRSSAVAAFEAYPVQPPPPPLRFSSIYTSNMVLQAAPAKPMLWGFTNTNRDDPIGMVGVSAGSGAIIRAAATLSAIPANWQPDKYADYNSIWSVKLPAVEPSFANYTFTVETASKSETAILENVVFGDVWLCGGQSNMEYGINGSNGVVIKHPPVNNSVEEIAEMAQWSFLRLFRTGEQSAGVPALEPLPASYGGGATAPYPGWSEPCPVVNGLKACRVDFSSMCYFFGRNVYAALAAKGLERPIGLLESCVSGTTDEAWSSPDALKKCSAPSPATPIGGSNLWNGMIAPLLNMSIKGAIWYQGESDATHPGGSVDGYNCTFPAMVNDWRSKFHRSTNGETDARFPFGVVQLNSIGNATVYNNPADPTNGDPLSPAWGYAGLRWSQSTGHGFVPNAAQPNVFMAVSVDTPDRPTPYPINGKPQGDPQVTTLTPSPKPLGFGVHSPFKQPTAARLARAGLAVAYNFSFDSTGPTPGALKRGAGARAGGGDGSLVLTIENVGAGVLPLRSSKGFEVLSAGEGLSAARWVSVVASATTSDSVTITGVPADGTKLRYNWYSNPCGNHCFGCAVYVAVEPLGPLSGAQPFLPLPPFIAKIPQLEAV